MRIIDNIRIHKNRLEEEERNERSEELRKRYNEKIKGKKVVKHPHPFLKNTWVIEYV